VIAKQDFYQNHRYTMAATDMSAQDPHIPQPHVDDGKLAEQITRELTLDKDPEHPTAPDQFDERYCTTKWEIWAYYACVDCKFV
jgi:hypothetical protein